MVVYSTQRLVDVIVPRDLVDWTAEVSCVLIKALPII